MAVSLSVRTWAAISFGMGSLLIFVEVFIRGIIGYEGALGRSLPVGWSIFGVAGAILWIVGIVLLITARFRGAGAKSGGSKSILLRGRQSITCGKCKKRIDTSYVGYHERIRCECGEEYDLFQDMPWDEEEV